MRRTEQKRENWERRRAIVERFATSGQRAEEFCKQEGLSFYAFSKWRSRLKQLDREANTLENATLNPASVFVEVKREKDRTQRRSRYVISSTAGIVNVPRSSHLNSPTPSREFTNAVPEVFKRFNGPPYGATRKSKSKEFAIACFPFLTLLLINFLDYAFDNSRCVIIPYRMLLEPQQHRAPFTSETRG